jgi:hypothetical protein
VNQANFEKFVDGLKKASPFECEFSVGDVVTFTNDYGVPFEGLTILGFTDKPLHGRFIHLDTDSWWLPVRPDSLKKGV